MSVRNGNLGERYLMVYFGYCNEYDIISLPLDVAKRYRKGNSICIEYTPEQGGWATGRILQIGTKEQVENSIAINLANLRHMELGEDAKDTSDYVY